MLRRTAATITAVLLSLPLLGACDGGALGPDGTSGELSVLLKQGSSSGSAALAASLVEASPYASVVSLDDVESITVTVDEVQALRDPDGEAVWESLPVTDPEPIDLLALSPSGGLTLARGDLPDGEYRNVRLFFTAATITFASDVALGGSGQTGVTYEAGDTEPLFIPSGEETGVKIPTGQFALEADDVEITIVFDPEASVQTVTLANDMVIMSPVLTAEGESD